MQHSILTENGGHPGWSCIRVRVPPVRQPDGYTCGVAALQSVLHYYGHSVRFDALSAALGADPDQGTNHRRIAAYAQAHGIDVMIFTEMGLDALRALIDAGIPVIVALQAWGDNPQAGYVDRWDDGHYVVVVGYDHDSFYFMDPSTLGNYTYLPIAEFLARWHDCYSDAGQTVRFHQFGMAFLAPEVCYIPERILRMQ